MTILDKQLVEAITKLVIEKLTMNEQSREIAAGPDPVPNNNSIITSEQENSGLISLFQSNIATNKEQFQIDESLMTASPFEFEEDIDEKFENARTFTPARIGVGRSGNRPKTKTWLKFRLDHAAAVDAVYGEVTDHILEKLNVFTVHTKVDNKETYILRPDLGRRLRDEGRKQIIERCKSNPTVQIIISNGLSAKAIQENLEDVYLSLIQSLKSMNLETGTTFYIHDGRVSLMDEIGEILKPDVVVYLIGERPGLVSAESLSAYLCYKPRIGTIEADRMVVSNIHKGGIPPVEAGAYLGSVVQKILKYEASGVNLVEKEG